MYMYLEYIKCFVMKSMLRNGYKILAMAQWLWVTSVKECTIISIVCCARKEKDK